MKVHELKIMPEYFDQVRYGNKRFEFRKNDRDFKVGDILRLKEWDGEKYTGEEIDASVRFILHQFPGMERGYCVLSIDTMMHYIPRKNGEWIPASEQLPKSMANKVLVWLEHDDLVGYIGYGHYEKYKGVETWYDLEHEEPFSKNGYRVTHWMPLPEPPKDGDGE